MKNEKRRHERFPISQDIMISLGKGPEIAAKGINISEGGLLCLAEREIDVGMLVSFTLTISSAKNPMDVTCDGVVLKCEKSGEKFSMVIDFTSVD